MKNEETMTVARIVKVIEHLAPPALQESYDNAGLLTGDVGMRVSGILICLDCTEEVLKEAVAKKCNMIIAHHPILFTGIKRLTGANYVERTIIKAIRKKIAIYACHTNLDNVAAGVNAEICNRLGIVNANVLRPMVGSLNKLVTFVPVAQAEKIRQALFVAGAGQVGNYSTCSFNVEGTGTFLAEKGAGPKVGKVGQLHHEAETRIEVILPAYKATTVIGALKATHPYEEVAYYLQPLSNINQNEGAGMVGKLNKPVEMNAFLKRVKKVMKCGVVKHTHLPNKKVERVAVCGGSGSFLLPDAIRSGADVFITSDFKYHQFFDADNKIVIADIGHYESEQFTGEIFYRLLTKNFPKFALHLAETNTNPVNYL